MKPPGLTHGKPCLTFGLAQNKMARIRPTMISSTGHLAMSQTVTAVEPSPSTSPTFCAKPPVTTAMTAAATSKIIVTTVAAVGYGVAGCPCLIPEVVRRAGGLVLEGGGGVGRCGLDRLGCLLCWVLEAGRGVLGRAGDGWRGGFFDLRRRMLLSAAGRQERAEEPADAHRDQADRQRVTRYLSAKVFWSR